MKKLTLAFLLAHTFSYSQDNLKISDIILASASEQSFTNYALANGFSYDYSLRAFKSNLEYVKSPQNILYRLDSSSDLLVIYVSFNEYNFLSNRDFVESLGFEISGADNKILTYRSKEISDTEISFILLPNDGTNAYKIQIIFYK